MQNSKFQTGADDDGASLHASGKWYLRMLSLFRPKHGRTCATCQHFEKPDACLLYSCNVDNAAYYPQFCGQERKDWEAAVVTNDSTTPVR